MSCAGRTLPFPQPRSTLRLNVGAGPGGDGERHPGRPGGDVEDQPGGYHGHMIGDCPAPAPILPEREQVREPVIARGQSGENGAGDRLAAQRGIAGGRGGQRVGRHPSRFACVIAGGKDGPPPVAP